MTSSLTRGGTVNEKKCLVCGKPLSLPRKHRDSCVGQCHTTLRIRQEDARRVRKAGPELLAALQNLVAVFNLPDDGSEDQTVERYFRGPLKDARKAIDHATND